jgi:acetamidase/formamidase
MSRTLEMSRTHYVHDDSVHYKWDTGNQPLLTIDSGDTVDVWTRDISDVAVDLKISEIVDGGQYIVSSAAPRGDLPRLKSLDPAS